MSTAPTFRKIMRGLYGTGIYREPIGHLPWMEQADLVEVVIDKTTSTAWYVREMAPSGELTDNLGDAFYTLADAKEYVIRRAEVLV